MSFEEQLTFENKTTQQLSPCAQLSGAVTWRIERHVSRGIDSLL